MRYFIVATIVAIVGAWVSDQMLIGGNIVEDGLVIPFAIACGLCGALGALPLVKLNK